MTKRADVTGLREAYDRGWQDRGAVDIADSLGPDSGSAARKRADEHRASLAAPQPASEAPEPCPACDHADHGDSTCPDCTGLCRGIR